MDTEHGEPPAPIADEHGNRLCLACGTKVDQPATGRRRDYCRRSCRQRAYEERRHLRRVADALGLNSEPRQDGSQDGGDVGRVDQEHGQAGEPKDNHGPGADLDDAVDIAGRHPAEAVRGQAGEERDGSRARGCAVVADRSWRR
ncbi:hypothetical protein [Streptomyces buecherae]|uniref:hypothetical protein n=1 Tax=Streptomyces buecherae TaxID=2763006 RepID=UPI0037AB9C57